MGRACKVQRGVVVVPTAGDGQDMRLPGQDVEHASNGDAGQRAVEAAQAEVDGVQGRCYSEGYERRQASVLSLGGASHGAHLPALKTTQSSKPGQAILLGICRKDLIQ